MAKITYLPGEVVNASVDENGNRLPVTRTQHIFDDTMNKPQSQVNEETAEAISDEVTRAQNAESGLDTRLHTVEELAEISVGGGDIGIGTAADFESDDPEDLAKVPTVGAMLGGANDGVYDISARHSGTKYADLAAALGTNGINVPVGVRKGGMSVKFVQSSDNKYVQYFLTKDEWSVSEADWEKMNIEADVSQLGQDVSHLKQDICFEDITFINNKYITPDGFIDDSLVGFYTSPIFLRANETITYSIKGFGCAILSIYNNGTYTPIVIAGSSETSYVNETYTPAEDCYVVFSGTPNTLAISSSINNFDKLQEQVDEIKEEVYNPQYEITNGKYIKPDGTIGNSVAGFYTSPIFVPKNATITYSIRGLVCAILSKYDNGVYTPLVIAPNYPGGTYTNETYTPTEDCYIVFSGTPDTLQVSSTASRIDSLETELSALETELSAINYDSINGKYIMPDGQIGDSAVGFYSTPIFVPKDSTLTYSIEGFGCAILSLYNNGSYTPIVVAPDGSPTSYTNETFTAEEDCYVVFSGTPQTLKLASDFSRIDSLETEIRTIDNVENNGSYYETIKAGVVTNDGEIKLGSLSSVLFFIPGGHGFYLELNNGYVVQSSHLFDESTKRRLQSNFVGSGTWVPLSYGERTLYGQDTTILGQFIAVVIKKKNNSTFNEGELETVINRYCRLDNSHLHRWVIEQPYFLYAHKRMRAISNLQWLCKEKVQAVTSSYNSVRFLKGETYNGVPYSDVSEKNKYVGVYVTPYTFLTAAANKRSLVYTENLAAKTSGYGITYDSIVSVVGCYYGSVCSGFTAAIMGLQLVYLVSGYAPGGNVPNLTTISNANDIQPLDLIYYSGHISIISDIYRDDYGKIKYIVWAEYNYPNVFLDVYTIETFKERLTTNSATIRRYSAWGNTCTDVEIPEDIPADTFDYARPLPTNKDIYVFSGDKSCFSLDDIIYLNLNRENGYTHLLVYKNDAETPFINVDISQMESDNMYEGEDWVKYNLRQHELGFGKYRAVLYDGENYSNNCYFEIIDTSFTLNISGSTINSVSFTAQNGLPFAIMSSSRNYYTYRVKEFTEQEQDDKTVTLNWPVDSGHPYITVLFRGEYGVAQKRVNTIE